VEEPVVDEDVLDDLLKQEDGPVSKRMKQILDSFRIPSKPPTGEADVEMLVEGATEPFLEGTKLGEAPTSIQSDAAILLKETADDGMVDNTGYAVKELNSGEPDVEKLVKGADKSFSAVTKLREAPTPTQSDPAHHQKETADDGKVDTGTGYVVKEEKNEDVGNENAAEDKATVLNPAADEKKAESMPGVSILSCSFSI
jgi:hypothetical protein